MFSQTDIIFNEDKSVYHLGLLPEQVATTLIFVGDPERVSNISKYFDVIEHRISRREFVTHTGRVGNKRISVISTGIGTGNIEIVMNELDILFNFDATNRNFKKNITPLQILRLGTSGSLQTEIPVNTLLFTQTAIGLDNLLGFYDYESTTSELQLMDNFADYLEEKCENLVLMPYVIEADKALTKRFAPDSAPVQRGITVTCQGFYAPQGRVLRGEVMEPKLFSLFNKYRYKKQGLANFEMETAGIYGMARVLGHQAASLSVILANRATNTFSTTPQKAIDKMIEYAMQCLTS